MADEKPVRSKYVITLKRFIIYKETVSLEVEALNFETAAKEAQRYARKHAEDGVIKWHRELASILPRITLDDDSAKELKMLWIKDQTKSDRLNYGEDDA